VDATGLADADIPRNDAGGGATVGSAGKPWWEAEASLPSGSTTRGRGGNAAAIPPTAKGSYSRAYLRMRSVLRIIHEHGGNSTPNTASRGKVEAEEGKEEGDMCPKLIKPFSTNI